MQGARAVVPRSQGLGAEEPGPAPAVEPPPEPVRGRVRVRFHHHLDEFDVVDGVLDFEAVDDKYCIWPLFRGEWNAALRGGEGEVIAPDGGALTKVAVESDADGVEGLEGGKESRMVGTFSGVAAGGEYTLEVHEDPEVVAEREEEEAMRHI